MTTTASVDASTVRHRFNYDWAMDADNGVEVDTYWWYATSVRLDPNEVWAEDEDGTLWVVPFSTDGEDEVTFGEPVRARLTAVPVAASAGVAATATVDRRAQRVLADDLQRPDKPAREGKTTAAEPPEPQEGNMDPDVRAYLEAQGIDPDQATEEQTNAASVFVAAGWTPPEAEVEQPEPVAEEVVEPELVAAAAADGTERIDSATLADLKAGAATARELDAKQKASDRDSLIASAIDAGKFPPSRREHYATAYDADPKGTRELIDSLADGLVPVDERGTSREPDGEQVSAAEMDVIRASFGINTTRKEA
jgi:hypothetical protein